MNRTVHILRIGKCDYLSALKLQQSIANQVNKLDFLKFRNVLILTEHNPVYTIGIRDKNYTLKDEERLKSLGAEFYKTNRGGLITFHGVGQMICYPILHLKCFQPSIRWYISTIEKTIIHLCKQYDMTAVTTKDTGVWINDKKICAIGIHGSRYITTHGLALNCNTDLKWFDHIVPCGIEGKGVTSFTQELKRNSTINEITPKFLESFKENFDCKFIDISNENKNPLEIFNELT